MCDCCTGWGTRADSVGNKQELRLPGRVILGEGRMVREEWSGATIAAG